MDKPPQIEPDRFFVRLPSGEEYEVTRNCDSRQSWKPRYVYIVETPCAVVRGEEYPNEFHGVFVSEQAARSVAAGINGATVERRELQ